MITIYLTNRKEWRAWLSKNYKTAKEIWLVYYKVSSGKKRIPYDVAVEEALCYGWIDSTVRSIDKESFAQRFSPRRKNSNLSEPNKQRVRKLIKQKKMTKAGLNAIAHAFNPVTDLEDEKLIVPRAILKALQANPDAWKHFKAFSDDYKRARIAYIESRKKQGAEQYKRSLENFVNKTAKNKLVGISSTKD